MPTTDSTTQQPVIGVGVIDWRDELVLLGKRLQPDGSFCWQFPGGRLDAGESVIDCAVREVREETGLELQAPKSVGYTERPFRVGEQHYLTLYVAARCESGVPRLQEPDKCGGWHWFPADELPTPLFEPILLYLEQHAAGAAGCRHRGIPSAARI